MGGELPTTVWSGSFDLGSVQMKCHVLSNGQRIIEADSLLEFLTAITSGAKIDPEAVKRFGEWQRGGMH